MMSDTIGVKKIEVIRWNYLGEIGIFRQLESYFLEGVRQNAGEESLAIYARYVRKKMVFEFAEALAKRLLGEDDEPEQGETIRKMARNGILLKLNEADLIPDKDGKMQIRMDVLAGDIAPPSVVNEPWADVPVKLVIPSLRGGTEDA